MSTEAIFGQGIDIVRYILIFGIALLSAYALIKMIEFMVPALLRIMPQHKSFEPNNPRSNVETFFNISSAVTKGLIIITALFLAYRFSTPTGSPVGLIG